MRTTIVLLSTLAVSLATCCGQTPIQPNVTHVRTAKVGGNKAGQYIVGGDLAVPYSWPWMVFLCSKNWFGECELRCGGTVVAPGWIMTAAQCIYDYKPSDWNVNAGVFDKNNQFDGSDKAQVVGVKAIHLHPQFNSRTNNNDVALLELSTPLVYNDHIQPVCLPKTDEDAVACSGEFWATGWGSRKDNTVEQLALHQANIPLMNDTICAKEYPAKVHLDTMFCAGGFDVAACYEDLGGPLVKADASGSWFQYGIFSWSSACGALRYPGIYTRVTAFCDWINSATNGAAQCNDVL